MLTATPWSSGSRSASTEGWFGCRGACFSGYWPSAPAPERSVEARCLQRIRFENVAKRKLHWRALTQDGNVEIRGRDLR
jgi:hypothetical protein